MKINKQHIALIICYIGIPISILAQKQSKPNIVFILTDDMGYGDLGIFFQNQLAKKITETNHGFLHQISTFLLSKEFNCGISIVLHL